MATLLNPFLRADDANGDPVSGGQLAIFEAGTTTPVTTYSDRALTTAQARPLIANAAGEFAQSFVASGIYKIRVSDADGVTLYENDNMRIADRPDDPVSLDDYAAFKADTATYATGTIVVLKSNGFRYQKAANSATDSDITRTDGAKFYLLQGETGYSVEQIGAAGDGSTNDSSAFQWSKQGRISAPQKELGYVVGDGSSSGTNITTVSKQAWVGDKTLMLHQAENAAGQAQLFTINDCTDVSVKGFIVDGQDATRNGVTIAGTAERIRISDMHMFDLKNFAIQYADADTNAATAYFDTIWVENVKIDGTVGPTGDGAGINLFPRAQIGTVPASKNAFLSNCNVDVSQGEASEANHGPQAYKFNNIDGIFGESLVARGGDVAAFIITNGCRRVRINGLATEFANRGLQIDTSSNVSTTITQDVEISGFSYKSDGIDGDGYSVYLQGSPVGVRLLGGEVDGDFVIGDQGTTDDLQGLVVENYRFNGSNFRLLDPGAATNDIECAVFKNIELDGGPSSIQFNGGSANRGFANSVFDTFISKNAAGTVIQNYGPNNTYKNVIAKDTNAATNSAVLLDWGDGTIADVIRIAGGSVDFFVRKRGGNGLTVRNISGTPADADGFRFENQEDNDLPVGNIRVSTPSVDLSGAAIADTVFFTADKECYILGVSLIYTEATSADAGVQFRMKINGGTKINYTTETSQAKGERRQYINHTGTRAFAGRKLQAGDTIEYQCDGGKTGAGAIMMIVSIVEVI